MAKRNLFPILSASTASAPFGQVGNWLETKEAIEVLQGIGPSDITELTLHQAAQMLLQSSRVGSLVEGLELARAQLGNGAAFEKFVEMVTAQGGDATVVRDPSLMNPAAHSETVCAPSAGWVAGIDAFEIGLTSVALGAGRQSMEDTIDPAAGFQFHAKVGERVERGSPLFTVFTEHQDRLQPGVARSSLAVDIAADSNVHVRPLISHACFMEPDTKKFTMQAYSEYQAAN